MIQKLIWVLGDKIINRLGVSLLLVPYRPLEYALEYVYFVFNTYFYIVLLLLV